MSHVMIFTRLFLSVALLGLVFIASCSKDDLGASLYNPVPVVTVLDISPDTVTEFQQIINLTLQYEDGDGDIGEFDPDVGVVFVKDSRLATADEFHVPPLAPLNAPPIAIKGTLTLQIKNSFILGNAAQEKINYSLWLRDRAGHESEVVTTPYILIKR